MPKNKQFDEQEVLNKASSLFNKKGFNGTSMDELVQATGLSRSSIYDTFGDKYSIYLRCLNYYSNNNDAVIDEALEKIESPRKRIQLFFGQIVKLMMADSCHMGCLMVNATTELAAEDSKIAKISSDNRSFMEDRFYRWVKEGQAMGEIGTTHTARSLARHLYNTVVGLRVTGKVRPDKSVLKDIISVTLSLLD